MTDKNSQVDAATSRASRRPRNLVVPSNVIEVDRRHVLTSGARVAAATAVVLATPTIARATPIRAALSGGGAPLITSVVPGSGGHGTPITINGSGFDPNPINNCVGTVLGSSILVTSASPTQLQGLLRAVGTVGSTQIMVITGIGQALPDFAFNDGVRISTSTGNGTFMGNIAGTGGTFVQNPLTPQRVDGVFSFSGLSFDIGALPPWQPNAMVELEIHFRTPTGWCDLHPFTVTFGVGPFTTAQCANHIASHFQNAGAGLGLTVSVSGNIVTVVKAGSTSGFGHIKA